MLLNLIHQECQHQQHREHDRQILLSMPGPIVNQFDQRIK